MFNRLLLISFKGLFGLSIANVCLTLLDDDDNNSAADALTMSDEIGVEILVISLRIL